MIKVRLIDRPEAWDSLGGAWDRLLERSATNSVFLTHTWLRAWWRWFGGPSGRLHIVAAFDGDDLRAAAPLYRCRMRCAGVAVRCLSSLTNSHTPKYDWLWRPDAPEALEAVVRHLRRDPSWDMLRLDYVPAESSTVPFLRAAAGRHHLRFHRQWCISSPFVDVTDTWQEHQQRISSELRSKTRKSDRRLQELGRLELADRADAADLREQLRRAMNVEKASWKGRAGTAIADHPEEVAFYTQVAEAAARRGWLRLYMLELDGRAIAFNYALTYNDAYNSLKIGYDPAYERHSPGNVLRMRVMQALFEERRFRWYDMLGAVAPWKLRWGSQVRDLDTICLFAPRPSAWVAYWLRFGIPAHLEGYPRIRSAVRRIRARLAAHGNDRTNPGATP